MSKIKNGGLDQYGAEPFKQQQFGTAGAEGVNFRITEYKLRTVESNHKIGAAIRVLEAASDRERQR